MIMYLPKYNSNRSLDLYCVSGTLSLTQWINRASPFIMWEFWSTAEILSVPSWHHSCLTWLSVITEPVSCRQSTLDLELCPWNSRLNRPQYFQTPTEWLLFKHLLTAQWRFFSPI